MYYKLTVETLYDGFEFVSYAITNSNKTFDELEKYIIDNDKSFFIHEDSGEIIQCVQAKEIDKSTYDILKKNDIPPFNYIFKNNAKERI